MLPKRTFTIYLFFVFCLLTFSPGWSICYASLTLEGQFIRNSEIINSEQQIKMTVRIYDDEFGGDLLFAEDQNVTAGPKKSVFIFEQGKVTTHKRTSAQEPENLWVEVESDGQVLSPRLKLSYIDTVNDLEGDSISLRNASLRAGGTATLLIDNTGVTLGNLLNLTIGGVARNTWPSGGGSSTDADTLNGHDSSYFIPASDYSDFMPISTDNWVNTTGDTMSGALTVNGNLKANSSLYVGTKITSDNDAIYFDYGTQESLQWNNKMSEFQFSDDLKVYGSLKTNSDLYIGTDDTSDNDAIYFDTGTTESLQWNNSAAEFQLSDDLQVNGEYRYASAKGFYYQIPPCQFAADISNNYILGLNKGYLYSIDSATGIAIFAPVHLPEGATITSVRAYYYDNSNIQGFDYFFCGLYRRTPTEISVHQLSFVNSPTTRSFTSNNILQITDSTIDDNIVDKNYQYYVEVVMQQFSGNSSADVNFRGCRITYRVDKVSQ